MMRSHHKSKLELRLNSPKYIFSFSFIIIISVYLYTFGQEKTIELITKEYLFILALIPLSSVLLYFKIKLKKYELINFINNSHSTLKTTIIFFLIFQIVDYIYEDGLIGMISQWFSYWLIGIIAILLLEIINYYKNYQLFSRISK